MRSVKQIKRIIVGECYVADVPTEISTVLGSCTAVCLFDPWARVGGMNHFMLPYEVGSRGNLASYGVHAMELLIRQLLDRGAQRDRLRAKAFGGGHVLDIDPNSETVGRNNIEFVLRFLESQSIPLVAHRLGGAAAVRVRFHTHTSRAFVATIPSRMVPPRLWREVALSSSPLPWPPGQLKDFCL